jgi:quercetin dioxygenase-like cupin family protein
MTRQELEEKYSKMGLVTRYITDKPGEVYEPHKHGGVYLFTLKGSAKIKLDDGEWQVIEPGQETSIEDNQLHEAIAGPEGWEYIFAATPEELERQGLR